MSNVCFSEVLGLIGIRLDMCIHVYPIIADMSRETGQMPLSFILKGQGHFGQRSNVCFPEVLEMKLDRCIHSDPIVADMSQDWAKVKFVRVKVEYTHGSRSLGLKVKHLSFEILGPMGEGNLIGVSLLNH